ncbi:MAG: hypothetical protein QNJ16_10360 [Rhodobacter sp.]|nr:hypothetical protein [Rhodobacter sp.]
MQLKNLTGPFLRDEDGAITVDWVVITAAVVGIALAVMITLGGATDDYSDTIASTMDARGVSSY